MAGGWRQSEGGDAKASRSLRSRKYKRAFHDCHQTKRLFTPEIKKFLKAWLVRRRKNPYPNRSEKKDLALKTGLTYTQICNWFANWRRKLKNSRKSQKEGSWGLLIKGYNTQARGNVEQFSISSDDSIWDETNISTDSDQNSTSMTDHAADGDHCYYSSPCGPRTAINVDGKPAILSKWLETSPSYGLQSGNDRHYLSWSPYSVAWEERRRAAAAERRRLEMDAAEALTRLSAWLPQQQVSIPGH
ncbi:Homeobox domain [Nesidiocoris tenuis]|uniref:Homeobox domain n=1 Tax=Nesidiocoris tenuis TaxID=355587 RepID=A0ABN7ACS5_9HEMI|nr:Homeobox domain [Nesidiocoris tenuis]